MCEEVDDGVNASAEVADDVRPDGGVVVCDNNADTDVGVDAARPGSSTLVVGLAGSVAPRFVAFCP